MAALRPEWLLRLGPGYTEIWKSLYDRFGLGFESSLHSSPLDEYWNGYLYFNAGFFYR